MGQTHGKKDLTPEEFDQLARSSGFTNAEVHEWHEKFKHDFPKGYVDKKGFKAIYTSQFPQGSGADKFADHIFRVYDIDGNGQISFQAIEEGVAYYWAIFALAGHFLMQIRHLFDRKRLNAMNLYFNWCMQREFVSTLHVGTSGTPEEKLRASFRMYDVDKNGSITQKELTDILTAIYRSRKDPQAVAKAKQDAEKIMFQLDTDHNKKLSEQEFVQAVTACPMVLQLLQGD